MYARGYGYGHRYGSGLVPEKETVRKIIVRIRTCSSGWNGARQVSFTHYDFSKLITPSYGVSFGCLFQSGRWSAFTCERLREQGGYQIFE